MKQLFFPLILRFEGVVNVDVPKKLVQDLVTRGHEPESINKICFQYQLWTFINELGDDTCMACGDHLSIKSQSTTNTCSPRCHQLVKRKEVSPISELKLIAQDRLKTIQEIATGRPNVKDLDSYPWHKINNGWKYVLHN